MPFTFVVHKARMLYLKPIKPINMRGFSFSWKRFLGVTQVKQQIARKTGIPTTQNGLERKIGSVIIKAIFGKR